jgi:RND family efflux transporter MFP subunit
MAEHKPTWSLLALACAVACSGGEGAESGAGTGRPEVRVPVAVAAARRGTISRTLTVSGTVEPIREVGVNSRVAGEILRLNAEEGDAVREGQVLAALDDREVRSQLTSAEAAFEVAEAAFERSAQLHAGQIITQAEYDRDRSAYAAARAQLEQLQTRAQYSTIRSPLAGVVTEKLIEAGDIVGTQARLFTVADVSTMVVPVPVSELDVGALAAGDSARVTLDAFPDQPLAGQIRRVFPAADPVTRLVPVEVELPGGGPARPGFLARVTFDLDAREDVILLPAAAMQGPEGGQFVYVVEDDRVSRRPVEAGITSRGDVEVRTGLAPGERVVTTGQSMVREGALVQVVEPTGAPEAPVTARDSAGAS